MSVEKIPKKTNQVKFERPPKQRKNDYVWENQINKLYPYYLFNFICLNHNLYYNQR